MPSATFGPSRCPKRPDRPLPVRRSLLGRGPRLPRGKWLSWEAQSPGPPLFPQSQIGSGRPRKPRRIDGRTARYWRAATAGKVFSNRRESSQFREMAGAFTVLLLAAPPQARRLAELQAGVAGLNFNPLDAPSQSALRRAFQCRHRRSQPVRNRQRTEPAGGQKSPGPAREAGR
jgi:hypothetical protein